MIDASRYLARETLGSGLEVCFRASRPDDCERVIEAFNELDPESVYLRFFGPKKGFSATELKNFREADFIDRVILLGTVMRDGREVVIASAIYVRVGGADAEVAFVVEEDYHRLGIAGKLLRHLGRIAKDGGIRNFVAEVLPHNNGMLRVFERSGWPMVAKKADGTVHVTLALSDG